MNDDQIDLIEAAGLRPKHVTVVGYAEACEGEPELLTGTYNAASKPAFLVIRRFDEFCATASLSALPYATAPTEMERERLNAVADVDSGIGQADVIRMVRERQPATDIPNTDPEAITAPDLVPYAPELPPSPEIPPEISAAENEGWG